LQQSSNSSSPFVLGIDITSEAELKKRAGRAAKFGIPQIPTPAVLAAGVSEEEIQQRQERASRFGVPLKRDFDIATEVAKDIFDQTAHLGQAIRGDTLHVFGPDEKGLHPLGSNCILAHFKDYSVSWVEWLGAKSVNVVFEDSDAARRVFNLLAEPVPELESHTEEVRRALGCWRRPLAPICKLKSDDYGEQGTPVRCLFRFATAADAKKPKSKNKSKKKANKNGPKKKRRRKKQRQENGQGNVKAAGDTMQLDAESGAKKRRKRRNKNKGKVKATQGEAQGASSLDARLGGALSSGR